MKNQKSKIKNALFLSASVFTLVFSACKDETPKPKDQPTNENELITTVKLIFTDSLSGAITTATFKDIDGESGNPPSQFDTIRLQANKIYSTQILLLDESKSAIDTVSNEVAEEKNDHLFIFNPSNVNLGITILDKDDNNFPIGLSSKWRSGAASKGLITVTLKHQPGVKNGTATPGETDVEVVFPCIIK